MIMIETRLLQYFLAIAREQNITRAAEVLHITQPTLSKQMQDLEAQIGRPLLIRSHKKTTLTEDGLYLKNRAEEILKLLEHTENSFRQSDLDIGGDISIGCGEFASLQPVMKLISSIHHQYPDIHFHFLSGNGDEMIENLDKGLVDFAFVSDPEFSERFDYYLLPFQEYWGMIVCNDDPAAQKESVSLHDLEGRELLVPIRFQNGSRFQHLLAESGIQLNVCGTFTLLYNAARLIQEGYAAGVTMGHLTERFEGLSWVPFDPPVASQLYMVTKKYQTGSRACMRFIDELKNVGLCSALKNRNSEN